MTGYIAIFVLAGATALCGIVSMAPSLYRFFSSRNHFGNRTPEMKTYGELENYARETQLKIAKTPPYLDTVARYCRWLMWLLIAATGLFFLGSVLV